MDLSAIKNGKFDFVSNSGPKFWTMECQRKTLTPLFDFNPGELCLSGKGNSYVFGYWSQTINVKELAIYKFKVKFSIEKIEDINLNIFNVIFWLKESKTNGYCNADHISSYYREGDLIVGEDTFKVPPGFNKAQIQLGLRFSKNGKVCWRQVELVKTEPSKKRFVKITSAKFAPYLSGSQKNNLNAISNILEKAGALESDIVLLPEFTNRYNKDLPLSHIAETIPLGNTCELLKEKAAKYGMYVCATIIEKDRDLMFNTAIIFDRQGSYIGKYRKTHPYWMEEISFGLSPGNEYPVFDLDFGKVGIMICYDSFYSETARILALKGAELILFPNDGYERLLMFARAIDNRVYLAVSSVGRGEPAKWNMPAMILDPSGNILCETNSYGIISTKVEISFRPPLLNIKRATTGGTICTAPGGRRGLRNSMSNKLYKEITKEMKTWEKRPESFYLF